MKLNELKSWVNNLPSDFDDYDVVRADYSLIDNEPFFRVDMPLTLLTVDEETKEILLLSDSDSDVDIDFKYEIEALVMAISNDHELGSQIRKIFINNG